MHNTDSDRPTPTVAHKRNKNEMFILNLEPDNAMTAVRRPFSSSKARKSKWTVENNNLLVFYTRVCFVIIFRPFSFGRLIVRMHFGVL